MADHSLLPVYVLDLRAQMEAQLRCLTTIQRTLTAMHRPGERRRERHRRSLISQLDDVLSMNAAIKGVVEHALAEARQSPEEQQSPGEQA